jgi:cell division protein FtsA
MVRHINPLDDSRERSDRGPKIGERVMSVLDVGTGKVVCLICAFMSGSEAVAPRLLGFGHQRSQGLKASVVTDMDAAEDAVRRAIQQAEAMAGIAVEQVFLSVACGRLKSSNLRASTTIPDGYVTAQAVEQLVTSGRRYVERDGRQLLHMNAVGYRVDGLGGISDPIGLTGHELSSDLHGVSIDQAPLRNLMHVVERCNVDVAGVVASPYASAIAATDQAERHEGVVLIDIGAGSTTMAFFVEGHLVSVHAAPIGGNHLTFDIARALSTSVVEAERIKSLYGNMQPAHSGEHDVVPYKIAGDQDSTLYHVNRAELRDIIAPRIDALVGMISEQIETSSIAPARFARVVLTGGGSQLVGLADIAAELLDRPVRLGRADMRMGWDERLSGAAFSTVCGVALVARDRRLQSLGLLPASEARKGYLGQVGQWIRESF